MPVLDVTSVDQLTLPVSEQFSPTLQGEGPHAGRCVQFLRLGGCNLSCKLCDTPYTWDGHRFNLREELVPTTVADIVGNAESGLPIVISGGEPLLHQNGRAWGWLLEHLAAKGCEVHFETNGTIVPNDVTLRWGTYASVSPKLPNFPMLRRTDRPALAVGWAALAREAATPLAAGATLKFVVAGADDVDEALSYSKDYGWPHDRVWVMPEGTSTEALQERWPEVARRAARLRINASHRTHVLAFGDTKGT